jgi:hypothetical protein
MHKMDYADFVKAIEIDDIFLQVALKELFLDL